MPDPLPIAKTHDAELCLLPALANRHGLITGATGTGKTVTLRVLAEGFSRIGVPVLLAGADGREFRIDVLQRDPDGPPPPAATEKLALYVAGMRADSTTPENLGQGALAPFASFNASPAVYGASAQLPGCASTFRIGRPMKPSGLAILCSTKVMHCLQNRQMRVC